MAAMLQTTYFVTKYFVFWLEFHEIVWRINTSLSLNEPTHWPLERVTVMVKLLFQNTGVIIKNMTDEIPVKCVPRILEIRH